MSEIRIIGRKDRADFPMFEMFNVHVKIDSGAYSSSRHCSSVSEIKMNENESILVVVFLDESYAGFHS